MRVYLHKTSFFKSANGKVYRRNRKHLRPRRDDYPEDHPESDLEVDSESGQEQVNNQMPVDDNGGLQGQLDVPPATLEEVSKRAQEVEVQNRQQVARTSSGRLVRKPQRYKDFYDRRGCNIVTRDLIK